MLPNQFKIPFIQASQRLIKLPCYINALPIYQVTTRNKLLNFNKVVLPNFN